MWLFLVTEVLMFGGLFVAYGIFRGLYPDMFHEAYQHLAWKMGATNTVVLITSSITMALAVGRHPEDEDGRGSGDPVSDLHVFFSLHDSWS